MKAIVRNILLACLISTFALFGAIGSSGQRIKKSAAPTEKIAFIYVTERQKETLTCLSVAFVAWGLCIWRCAVINKRLRAEREYQRRFHEYMRTSSFQRNYY